MTERLILDVPDDLMAWLRTAAAGNFRIPESQVLWLIKQAWSRTATATEKPDPEALQALADELRKLQARTTFPSTRAIAREVRRRGGSISHTTVHAALKGTRLPSWPALEQIVKALDGDTEYFKALWGQVRAGR